jgi:hypothetical protein
MVFEYEKNTLSIYFSSELKLKYPDLKDHMLVQGEDIRNYIHRYDYRKLLFFSENPLIQPFDTFLRVKIIPELGYIKTQAVCKSHHLGFHCILIEDKYYHKLKPLWKLEDTKHTLITFLDESLEHYEKTSEINEFKSHLTKMLSKELN